MTSKYLALLALAPLITLVIVPDTPYHLAWFSGLIASVAFLIAVTHSYRKADYIRTRGGIVKKSEHPGQYLLAHLCLWLFGTGFLMCSIVGTFGKMK